MQILRIYLIVASLFEVSVVYFLYNGSKQISDIIPTFPNLPHNPETCLLVSLIAIILAISRLILAFDMTNKNMYLATLLIHITEAVFYVGAPAIRGDLQKVIYKDGQIIVEKAMWAGIIIIQTIWMIASYKSYTKPISQKEE